MQLQTLALSDADIESLERATLDAVAPPQVAELDGWLLPMDSGSIGRAKSAVPMRHHGTLAAAVPQIIAHYQQHGLEPAFRVADLATLAELHTVLHAQGLRPAQPTLVQVGSASAVLRVPHPQPAAVFGRAQTEWSAVYLAPGFDPVDGAHRIQVLSRSRSMVYAALACDATPAAAGAAALSHGWISIHGMRTVPHQRGRGLALRILQGLARYGQAQGLERMFLQVEEDNAAALSLYQRVGFTSAWRYHYWRRPPL
ncbi:MAG: GNAT family N-acetyltransferase [Rhodoferax sp.]